MACSSLPEKIRLDRRFCCSWWSSQSSSLCRRRFSSVVSLRSSTISVSAERCRSDTAAIESMANDREVSRAVNRRSFDSFISFTHFAFSWTMNFFSSVQISPSPSAGEEAALRFFVMLYEVLGSRINTPSVSATSQMLPVAAWQTASVTRHHAAPPSMQPASRSQLSLRRALSPCRREVTQPLAPNQRLRIGRYDVIPSVNRAA